MNDHNLDDLIIDTIAPKNNKTKSLLTLVALLIIVLIVGIILTKTLLKSPENDELAFEENMSEMIAPELKLQESTEVAKPKEEPSLPAIIEEKTKVKVPEVIHEETVSIEEAVKPVVEEKKPEPVHIKKPTVTKTKPAIELPVTQQPEHKKTSKVVTTSKPKTKVTKPKTTTEKPVVKHQAPKTTSTGKYYVQVGSFKENPSPRFLSVIKSSGFKYHVTNPDRTGYKKLLIGPYKTRAEVDKARDIIRDRIHKSAFVVQK